MLSPRTNLCNSTDFLFTILTKYYHKLSWELNEVRLQLCATILYVYMYIQDKDFMVMMITTTDIRFHILADIYISVSVKFEKKMEKMQK